VADYPPYVGAPGSLPKLFLGIKAAAVPPKVTQDFLETVLDLKSSSHRAYIPLLKRLGFLDPSNVPTQVYKDFRDTDQSGRVMSERLKEAYKPLFDAHEYAWKLSKNDLIAKLKNVTGAGDDDQYIPSVASTFTELSKLASWDGTAPPKKQTTDSTKGTGEPAPERREREETNNSGGLRLGYTINLNLPATTEIEVFNAIFKSLRENLLTKL
jgi:Family of unknown function (DUF5343)